MDIGKIYNDLGLDLRFCYKNKVYHIADNCSDKICESCVKCPDSFQLSIQF